MRTKQPTMKDVAKHAGVSLNVVSRVCYTRLGEYVSAAATEKVKTAIQELGYYPDFRARYLRSQRTNSIGFYAGNGAFMILPGFGARIFDGLQFECALHSQDLLVIHFNPDESPADTARSLTSSKVDGLVYLPFDDDVELNQALLRSGKPVVRIGEPYPGITSVLADDRRCSARLAHHLYCRGHRKVLYRRRQGSLVASQRRYEGFLEASTSLGMEVVTTYPLDRLDDSLSPEEMELLANFRTNRVTAVACWRDWSATRVLEFCTYNGIFVPDDLAVVGFDGMTPEFCPSSLRLTTAVVEWQAVAECAIRTLVDIIDGKDAAQETIHPCSIYIGNTS
jgi:DNA-binding LacI/PurR family transcriptional regulator